MSSACLCLWKHCNCHRIPKEFLYDCVTFLNNSEVGVWIFLESNLEGGERKLDNLCVLYSLTIANKSFGDAAFVMLGILHRESLASNSPDEKPLTTCNGKSPRPTPSSGLFLVALMALIIRKNHFRETRKKNYSYNWFCGLSF